MHNSMSNVSMPGSIKSYYLFDDQAHDYFNTLELSHRGVGKTTFLCRLMMYYATEVCTNVVMTFKTNKNIERFLNNHLLPAIIVNPRLRYRKKSNNEIIVCESYNIDVSVRKDDISICLIISELETHDQMMVHLQNYSMNGYQIMQHDSILVDMRMVKELKILKESNERLPLYIDHKWYWELLHRDYLKRLKKNTSFAAVV